MARLGVRMMGREVRVMCVPLEKQLAARVHELEGVLERHLARSGDTEFAVSYAGALRRDVGRARSRLTRFRKRSAVIAGQV